MDATLSESEELLRDTALRVASDYACESVADYDGYDDSKAWSEFAHLGLLAIRRAASGEGGGSTLDEAIVVDSLANKALAVPYLGGSAFVSGLLMAASAPDDTMSRLAGGELRCAIAINSDLTSMWGVATRSQDPPVAFDSTGASAALILESDNGLRIRSVALGSLLQPLDITRASHLIDVSTPVDVGSLGGVIEPLELERTTARFLVLLSADIVGVMEAALGAAVAYAATREQFGVPIATFQAIQHICADQLVSIEAARSLTEYAAWSLDECPIEEALIAAQSAKAYSSRAGRTVCEAAVQVHGGVGFTWDSMAHVYLKRALTDGLLFGNTSAQIDAIARERQRAKS
jgi:alkylation response protein AidB-like acyl-CoA dehydrogenase